MPHREIEEPWAPAGGAGEGRAGSRASGGGGELWEAEVRQAVERDALGRPVQGAWVLLRCKGGVDSAWRDQSWCARGLPRRAGARKGVQAGGNRESSGTGSSTSARCLPRPQAPRRDLRAARRATRSPRHLRAAGSAALEPVRWVSSLRQATSPPTEVSAALFTALRRNCLRGTLGANADARACSCEDSASPDSGGGSSREHRSKAPPPVPKTSG